jgi:hypothetical protein
VGKLDQLNRGMNFSNLEGFDDVINSTFFGVDQSIGSDLRRVENIYEKNLMDDVTTG